MTKQVNVLDLHEIALSAIKSFQKNVQQIGKHHMQIRSIMNKTVFLA